MRAYFPVLARTGLPCASGNFDHCEFEPAECAKHKQTLFDVEWETCPVRASIEDPLPRYIEGLHRQSKVCPLAGWPDKYTGLVTEALPAYQDELANVADWFERNA